MSTSASEVLLIASTSIRLYQGSEYRIMCYHPFRYFVKCVTVRSGVQISIHNYEYLRLCHENDISSNA